MDTRTFPSLAADYQRIKAALLAEYPDIDPETLADTIDGLTDAQDVIRELIRQSFEAEAMAGACRKLAERYEDRATHKMEQRARLRQAAHTLMDAIGERKVTAPEFTISIRAVPPKPDVYDEESLPETLWDYKTVRALNRDRLKAALTAGDVPGARMTNGAETIAVRS